MKFPKSAPSLARPDAIGVYRGNGLIRGYAPSPLDKGDFRGLAMHWECLSNSKIYHEYIIAESLARRNGKIGVYAAIAN